MPEFGWGDGSGFSPLLQLEMNVSNSFYDIYCFIGTKNYQLLFTKEVFILLCCLLVSYCNVYLVISGVVN